MAETRDTLLPRFMRIEIFSLVLALVIQGGGLIWWGSQMTARVATLEAKTNDDERRASDASKADEAVSENVARIDERTKAIDDNVAKIERALELDGSRSAHRPVQP